MASLFNGFHAADAPLRGIINTPPMGDVTEQPLPFPYSPRYRKRPKDKPADEDRKKDGSHPPDEDHLVDDYA